MKHKVAMLVVLFFLILMCFTVPASAAPPVDGFSGVRWGASREQVQTAMAEKGFGLLEQEQGESPSDTYEGTFAGHRAKLKFLYQKNRFYFGQATFLDVAAPEVPLFLSKYYSDIKNLYVAKYGQADVEHGYSDAKSNWLGEDAVWRNLDASAKPPGLVEIRLYCLVSTPYNSRVSGVTVSYSVGAVWANLQADGSNI